MLNIMLYFKMCLVTKNCGTFGKKFCAAKEKIVIFLGFDFPVFAQQGVLAKTEKSEKY